jgi:Uma2 family endonuclease
MITCDPLPEKHILKAPVLIAEVLLPSTASKGLTVKRELYESQGVKYYLTIDQESQHYNVLQLDSEKRYQSALAEKETALDQSTFRLELLNNCIVELDANSLF